MDEDTLRRYLLGELSEDGAEAFEEEHFDDPAVLARVRRAEDDLVDDYVAGRLSRADRKSFERHHLATPGQRERLVAASALRLMTLDVRAATRGRATTAPGARMKVWLRLAALLLALLLGWYWVCAVAR